VEITRYLLDHQAEVDKIDGSGWTPLHIAGRSILLSAPYCDPDKSTIVSAGNEDVVIELVGAGADVKKTNDKGLTPL
jgi:ankyrin repeat protein